MLHNKTKILITGANGLLGSHVLLELHQQYEIHAIVRTMPRVPIGNVIYYAIDLSTDLEDHSLPHKLDTIIHLAQSSHFRDFPDKALDVFYVNVESTARLLDYAQRSGVKRFIYASSGGVYGSGSVAFDENAPIVSPGQLNYYLGSKLCGEVLVQSYASLMNVIILRFFFVYGPGQKRSMLMPRLLDSVATGKPINMQGDKGICINPIHVKDASAAVAAAIKLDESVTFNIAGPDVLSIHQISKEMGSYLGKEPIFQQVEGKPKDLVADISAMRQRLCMPMRQLQDSFDDIAI